MPDGGTESLFGCLEHLKIGGFGLEELKYSFVAIDFETTGFLPKGEIIEIGMVKVVDGK